MNLLDQLLPGQVWDPSPLARMLPGEAPDPVIVVTTGITLAQGVAFVPVPGPAGRDGLGTVEAVAGFTGPVGTPVYVSRTDSRLYPATASTYLSAFVVGLVTAGIATGFIAQAQRGPVTLIDWTAITGSPLLLPGQLYFLSPAGLLTPLPPARPDAAALTRVGEAISAHTLDVNPSPPIQL